MHEESFISPKAAREKLKPKIGLCAGSFDPPTLGHEDLFKRSLVFCDHLIIGVTLNAAKTSLLPAAMRVKLIAELTVTLGNITVVAFGGLLVDFAKENNVSFLIRGMRSVKDFEDEYELFAHNRALGGYDTAVVLCDEKYRHITSSRVREIYGLAGKNRIAHLVSPTVMSWLP